MRKRILALTMAVLMAFSVTACGGKGQDGEPAVKGSGGSVQRDETGPKAADLLAKLSGVNNSMYNDMDMDLDLSGIQNGQQVDISFKLGAEMKGSVTHIYDGNVQVSTTGLTMTFTLESWSDTATGKSYQNMTVMGQESGWVRTTTGSGSDMGISNVTSGTGAIYDSGADFKVTGPTNGYYTMDWTVPAESLSGMTEGVSGDSDLEFGDAQARATFDSQSLDPLALTVSAAGKSGGTDALLTLNIIFKTVNGDKALEIPSEIVSSAVEEDEAFGGYGDDDYGYGYEEPEWIISHDGKLYSDGLAYDNDADEKAETIADSDPGLDYIYVYHYLNEDSGELELTSLSWSTEGDGWYGSAAYDHVFREQCHWFSPDQEFADTVDFLKEFYAEEYGAQDACVYEDGHQAAFLYGDDGYWRLEWCYFGDDAYFECTVGAFEDDLPAAELKGALLAVAEQAGLGTAVAEW